MSEPLGETGDVPREFQARIDELRAKTADTGKLFIAIPAGAQLFGCTLCGSAVPQTARTAHVKWHVFGTVEGVPDP